ncbi:monosaccharide ABC transporter membrane protein, CUT2 family [Chthonomonas calidirosea]|uniref:Monosaccharide ABC transporter membrane protein,CUT2 family (TC 3.A.1.2.-) n=1 Tax=Chthonomonas calidirosea (strain DSM 23976 / ICMP 18418 / T49) TaxID=1303518 RepID=S0ETI9_CHTCT|nr:ABC transporter permease [Chthonomonas calidirosea]CCW34455.1 monosaccharide ABC transporter membrane protein,CUT2 family (TC 3.A.1.2.-) [Chthonomonas calidirosea T49]CEK13513.1 monosaccharide ABC transporter membrane protein, CUT2 family [Chthonomonas calidirosea]CEK13514.1 monosaccharide ABC transporter membrane protein, CUT2 family [Chthonomonas calidirosea]CEK14736.1 monosaccharide ABC transporter membrane protein, CUT2 family [Chthonomonas calidirosea]
MREIVRNAGVYVAVIVVAFFFAIWLPQFRQPSNLLNVLDQSVEIAIVSVGMTMVILTEGIDLSVGSLAALAPFLGAWLITQHTGGLWHSAVIGVLCCLAVGGAVGLINGLAITQAYLPPFIATLGTMSIVRGLAYIVSHGTGITDLPHGYTFLGHTLPGQVTVGVVLMFVLYGISHLWLSRSATGRAIYAIGGNETAAHLSGLKVNRIKLGVYILCGILAALAGLAETAMVGASVPDAGIDLELNSIAAVVIGGTSLSGGRGNLVGTLAGALLMRLIRNGLDLAGIDSNWQKVAIGAIIMGAVAFDEIQKRRGARL